MRNLASCGIAHSIGIEKVCKKNINKTMTKKYFIYLIIIASIVLMIYNISELDFDNLKKGPFAGIVSNILLILTMLVTMRDIKKKEQENK
ncbi:hypothetical protein DZC78_02205 [Olleya aquimaris]|uniref:Uncharacterized protein n=1 Tax=Olleya sediminilitoris TaxID=2795739 RepID=A0ABS1WQ41_9FLAO|nr:MULTISPECIES: hypothetical protein [Olleya]AXO79239.1 hypothetical protein DZC78_02205 [Olleya aquimaris]MBL7561215.1 hypothetical protein [Olleya sediminilitoris]